MAIYRPVGEPANQSEEEAIRVLRDRLPEHFIVIGNFELQLPRRANTFEYDAVVIAEHGLYAVEIKGWSGEIVGDMSHWELDWGRVQNPLILLERKAKALRGFLSRCVADLPEEIFCQAVVLLPNNAILKLDDTRAERVIKLDQVYSTFVDEELIHERGPGELLDKELRERIERALLPRAAPATRIPRVGDYEIVGEYDDGERPYREFVARHRLLRSRDRVRIKRFEVDAIATSDEQQRQMDRALRDMEALTQLTSNPYIASAYEVIRDREDELIFYLVTEWVGPTTLRDFIDLGDAARSVIDPCSILEHLLRAVQFMHNRGIIHRNLRPGVIALTRESQEGVPFKITDFDYARMVELPSIDGMSAELGADGYAAPELWQRESYDHRVDIFSVGVIAFELFTGEPLYTSLGEMLDYEDTWLAKRGQVPKAEVRDLLDQLLQGDPNERPSDLSEAIAAASSCHGEPESEPTD